MVNRRSFCLPALVAVLLLSSLAAAQQTGSIRGVVYDKDFDAPLALAQVTIVETGVQVTATEEGTYVFTEVPPGQYTMVFSKEGYARFVRTDVQVAAGQLTDLDASLSGEFTEMEEYIVQDVQIGGGTEVGLLRLRFESPALMDSISADLMSRAGAGDAASALRLIAGTTVQDGKFAVVRGLPDRYVNSQLNSVRMPTADEDKRAVQLDQFPSAVIESIQVSKTFMPDQQGDASGGAVNVVLKGIPDATVIQFKSQLGVNTQVRDNDNFLTYNGGGVNFFGDDHGGRNPQMDLLGQNWTGATGVTNGQAPVDYKWSLAAGSKHEFKNGIRIGGFTNISYERDSSFRDNATDNSMWVITPGGPMVPTTSQGTAKDGDFKTKMFNVTKGSQLVQWSGLVSGGVEIDNHSITASYLYTRVAEDSATLAEDTATKGNLHKWWPDIYGPEFGNYDVDDSHHPANSPTFRDAAPFTRTETLRYNERTTETTTISGKHTLPLPDFGWDGKLLFKQPQFDWTVANSKAKLYEPDKRQFGTLWLAPAYNPGLPDYGIDPYIMPAVHRPFKPAAAFTLGNLQRIWKDITEESEQYSFNLKLPFEQWTGDEGYLKFGVFDDSLTRQFNQDTYSNFNDDLDDYYAGWNRYWSAAFPTEDHEIFDGPPYVDVDYSANQEIYAWYWMADIPLTSTFNVMGGFRYESTDLSIVNIPEENSTWYPPGSAGVSALTPGVADIEFGQDDQLPAIGFVYSPLREVTVRASYSQTVARQTFKELTPILQQEFLGGPIFIGNPELGMSELENVDFRCDYVPYEGGIFSFSWFNKRISQPIEYVQRVVSFTFTTPVNYPKGELSGFEFEIRQDLGRLWEPLTGLSVGGNATLINSEVTLPKDEAEDFESPAIQAPMPTRHMTNAPEHLYNLYMTYDVPTIGTQIGLFYTVKGDTLIAGAGQSVGNFVPSVYATEHDTLNLSIAQPIGKYLKLRFQAKNLTNPEIETVYRSEYIGADVLKTSYTKGVEYSISLSAEFQF